MPPSNPMTDAQPATMADFFPDPPLMEAFYPEGFSFKRAVPKPNEFADVPQVPELVRLAGRITDGFQAELELAGLTRYCLLLLKTAGKKI